MGDIILTLIILAIVGVAVAKIIIEKKKGAKCIGCPSGRTCKSNCNCSLSE